MRRTFYRPRMSTYAALAPVVVACFGWALHAALLVRQLARARCDALTGLQTRAHFTRSACRRLRRRPAVCGLLDVDRFKHINDSYGHQTGDAVLIALAHRLRAELPSGAVAGRFGGDELALVVPAEHADYLHRVLSRPVQVPGSDEIATVSVGWSGPIWARHNAETVLDHGLNAADQAMYATKRGRSRDARHTRQSPRAGLRAFQ